MVMPMTTAFLPALPWTTVGLRRGFLAALPFIFSNGIAGVAIGVAYRGAGLGFVPAVLFSLVVYSATAQAVTLGLWSVPLPIAAMVGACMAMNARYLLLGGHLRQLFPDVPRRVMLPTLFLLGDASWIMTVAEADRGRRDAGYLLGTSLPMALGWVGGTALGYALPLTPHGPLAVAAGFLPLAFIVALVPTQWRGTRSLLPWAVSATVAIATAGMLGQSWAMLTGGMAGALVNAIGGDNG
jgi:predicted branched-subunit amino acid permease